MSMLRCYLSLLILLLSPQIHFGQSQAIDSLMAQLAAKSPKADSAVHRIYVRLTDEYLKNNFDSALVYAEKSLDLATKLGKGPYLPASQFKMAEVYIRQRKPEKAIEFAKLAEQGHLHLGDTAKMIRCTNAIGGAYSQMNKFPEAIECFYRSKKLAEKIGDKTSAWTIANNIAMIENRRGNFQLSLDIYLEARENAKGIDEPSLEMNTLNGLANNYSFLGNHEKAIQARKEQIEIAKKTGDKRMLGVANINLAQSYYDHGDLGEAEKIALDAEKLLKEMGFGHALANNYLTLANISMAKKNFRQAIGYFKAAVPQFGETPDRENLAYAYEMLSKSYEDLGQMDSALFFYKRYSNIRDSVLTQEANGKLEEIKAQYETEKKEHQNQLLTAQNAVLFRSRNIYLALASLLAALLFTLSYFFIKNRKQKRQIEQQKNELEENARLKSKLFSIVAHDLRSPLVSLGGIAKKVNFLIQRNRVEEVQQLGESVEQAVSHVHKLLDNLLSWAMVQGGRFPHEPENIQLAGTLRETVELYRHSAEAKNITLLYDAPTDLQIRCDKNAFSTIVRNLLDNAIKFTPPNGQVALEAKLEKDFALIQVIDSGTGIDEATKQHLFAISGKKGAEGTHGEKGTGLGLSLCKELVEMNGGKIDVSSREGLGTTFRVLLPFIN